MDFLELAKNRFSLRKFSDKKVEKEIISRCGYRNYECMYPIYNNTYDELRTFEKQKMAEKEKRMSARQMPSLSGSMKGQAAVQPQPVKKSYMVSDEEARRRYQQGQKALDAVPEAECTDCYGD